MYSGLSVWLNSLSTTILVYLLIIAIISVFLGSFLAKLVNRWFAIFFLVGSIILTGLIEIVADGTYHKILTYSVWEAALIPIVPIVFLIMSVLLTASLLNSKQPNKE